MDRLLFWSSIAAISGSLFAWLVLEDLVNTVIGIGLAIIAFGASYFWRDKEGISSSSEEYAKVISQVSTMVAQLNELNQFFMREQQRIKDTEATVQKLDHERSELEPVVQTHRETVEAILSAHANRTARYVWKERLIGFGSGILTSILASIIYEFFRR